ncbi:MAG TPA: histidine phosphatase family protein, partial [Actinobacteria bacterium]|nr:histidine phosphatase family protein [Actinomycetota bacterium]
LRSALALILLISLSIQPSYASELLIWDKLSASSAKGYVLLLRHSLAPGVGDPENFKLGDCSTQRNLSQEGRDDAAEIGAWIKRQKVKIYRVESSRWCRARQSAELLDIGKVKLNKNLDSLFRESNLESHPKTLKTKEQILNHRNKSGLLVLVGHYVNIAALVGVGVDSGEGLIVKANKNSVIKVLGATPNLGN